MIFFILIFFVVKIQGTGQGKNCLTFYIEANVFGQCEGR